MKLAIVGVGKLGSALLEGVLNKGILHTHEVGILDRHEEQIAKVQAKFQVKALTFPELAGAERILIAVQPRQFLDMSSQLIVPGKGYISTMAGISTKLLAKRLHTERVVRTMPNLAATVGKSATALTAPSAAHTHGDYDFGASIFKAVGEVYNIPEHLFNAFTGMVGSGPAYAAVFAEALADGGVRNGLTRHMSHELAARTLIAAGELILKKQHPAIVKDEVASPGGTTIAGLSEMERYTFRIALIEAVTAATRRGFELGVEEE